MKNNNEKDRLFEMISVLVSFLTVCALMLSGSGGKVSVAVASAMFQAETKAVSSAAAVVTQNTADTTQPQTTAAESEAKDITATPDDIKALIKKYTELFAKDKKDGSIKSVTYVTKGATHMFGDVCVKNTTETKSLNIEKVLSEPLELSVDKAKPAVLIFHSHTSEGYEMIERDWYACDYSARSNDENINIVRVGKEIADYLTAAGYTVIHDKTIHDKSYNDSYPNSRKTVAAHLKEHPEIQVVLDIHRDSVTQTNGDKLKFTNDIGGKKAAQIMIITGAEEGKVEDFPKWEQNLRFALALQQKSVQMFPGLMRPVLFSQRKYNMDMTPFSLLIEMGSEANTLEEACYSGRMLAASLAALMDEYTKEQ